MPLLYFQLHMSAQRVYRTIGTIGGSGSGTRVTQATRSAFDQVYARDIQGHSQVPTVMHDSVPWVCLVAIDESFVCVCTQKYNADAQTGGMWHR